MMEFLPNLWIISNDDIHSLFDIINFKYVAFVFNISDRQLPKHFKHLFENHNTKSITRFLPKLRNIHSFDPWISFLFEVLPFINNLLLDNYLRILHHKHPFILIFTFHSNFYQHALLFILFILLRLNFIHINTIEFFLHSNDLIRSFKHKFDIFNLLLNHSFNSF